MKKPRKLQIEDLMAAVDRRDSGWLSRQPEDAQKEFAAPVALRFTSTVKGPEAENYVWLTNDVANVHYHDLYQHPELQFRLLSMCGSGKRQYHVWLPMQKMSKKSDKVFSFLSRYYPAANSQEIDAVMGKYTTETFSDLVNFSGVTPEEAKDLISAFKKQADE